MNMFYANSIEELPERFDSALREVSMDAHRVTGDVEAPMGWNALMGISSVDLETVAVRQGIDLRDFKPGVYIIKINSDGLIWGFRYGTESEAEANFAAIEEAYGNWLGTEHSKYPHIEGYLIGCVACEERCHCTEGNAECVFDGPHNGKAAN